MELWNSKPLTTKLNIGGWGRVRPQDFSNTAESYKGREVERDTWGRWERALTVAAWWGRTELRLLVAGDGRERPSLLLSREEERRLVARELCCSRLKCVWCSHATNNGFYTLHKTICLMQSFVRISAPYV